MRCLAREIEKDVITYGMDDSDADYTARDIRYSIDGTTYKLYHNNEFVADIRIIVPGRHNVLNSAGAFAAAREMGISIEDILCALSKFTGAKRRFETKGKSHGVWVVDDYAHHPTEIKATLKAARQVKPERLLCVFQPHRYTRTKLLFEEFCQCFTDCDELIITDIYPAGEKPLPGISSAVLAESIKKLTGQKVEYIPQLHRVEEYLEKVVLNGDLIVTIGAGNVFKVGEELIKELEH